MASKILIMLFLSVGLLAASANNNLDKKDKKSKDDKVSSYEKTLKDAESSAEGLIQMHKVDKKFYFEVTEDILGKDLLFTSHINKVSNDKVARIGQMTLLRRMRLVKEDDNIFMNEMQVDFTTDESNAIAKGFNNNFSDATLEVFPIVATNEKEKTYLIDVSKFMLNTAAPMGMPKKALWNQKPSGALSPNAKLSKIIDYKSFDTNIAVQCRFGFTDAQKAPVAVIMQRNITLLPEEPMERRIYDRRMNYFYSTQGLYSDTDQEGPLKYAYVNKWRLTVSEKDQAKYKKGELVTPEQQIVWYVDNAFPESWKKYIKQGILDWNIAFEAMGFKDVMVVKDYPKNDDSFSPSNVKTNCFSYIPSIVGNAMGSSWADPRTGEMLGAQVYFSHTILKLAKDMRFSMTAAVDPEARKKEYSTEVMGELIRNISAHEIGHTLGLMHNFRGSYAIPTDSLRSASYTAENGITASIMDYTRYNYVAQPGDKGMALVPPVMGKYDVESIKWAYQPIFEETTWKEQYHIINKWITSKNDDPFYIHGPQEMKQVGLITDPASQDGDLGNDIVKSSAYGVENLKVIMENLIEWTAVENENYNAVHARYRSLCAQYNTFISHVTTLIGGINLYDPVYGDNKTETISVSKEEQKEALAFLYKQVREMDSWLMPKEIINLKKPGGEDAIQWQQRQIIDKTIYMCNRVWKANRYQENPYTVDEYMNDIFGYVWESTLKNKKSLTQTDRTMQNFYLRSVLSYGKFSTAGSKEKSAKSFTSLDNERAWFGDTNTSTCSCSSCSTTMFSDEDRYAMSIGSVSDTFDKIEGRTVYLKELNKAYKLLTKAVKTPSIDAKTKEHYTYLINSIEPFVN
ncbi:zinc-dependent metalloprotease [Carboxylicivirga sp. M1479]|uniref:zinc-dependent metalloprotease n=1 Tax=Carboxylicivirga sp. M1479 TaxID=2594476 RepID=UPI00117898D5|nr:zinc-dependent metalloprotease [Carboxylicivirga sp. M1479]TRX63304.1 zinc-dependent metalloprotease [Carboxylicivirga sp. M1479]